MNYFTNSKMIEIPMWDFVKLRATKEYQEKRKEFIEEKGGVCINCKSKFYLTVSHPQQYIKIIYHREKGKFYSSYTKLKWKEVCKGCYSNKAYEDIVNFKSEIVNKGVNKNKKRRTMIKSKYICSNCGKRYKSPRRIKINDFKVITELNNYQIPSEENYWIVCLRIQEEINKQQWKKYISFIDAELVCRNCHYQDHFIPLLILTPSEDKIATVIKRKQMTYSHNLKVRVS